MNSVIRPYIIALVLNVFTFFANGASPTIEPDYAALFVLEPRSLIMTCTSRESLTWYMGGQRVTELYFTVSSRVDVDESGTPTHMVSIKKSVTSIADSGVYSCQSEAGSRSITVHVFSVVPNSVEYTNTLDRVILSCMSSQHTTHWEFRNKTLEAGDKYIMSDVANSLVIKTPKPSEGGEYYCVFSFNANNQIFKIPVNLYVPPLAKNPNQSMSLIRGDRLTLSCAYYSYPPANITWFKNGQLVTGPGFGRIAISTKTDYSQTNSVLKIYGVDLADQGMYACDADNFYFNASATTTFSVAVNWKPVNQSGVVGVIYPIYLLSICLALVYCRV